MRLTAPGSKRPAPSLQKLMMKLTTILLLTACLQVGAKTFSQNITLSARNEKLESVIRKLKKQSGYQFFYNDALLKEAKLVNLDVRNTAFEKVLELCFSNQPFTYSIIAKTVVITDRKGTGREENLQPALPVDVHGTVTDEEGKPVAGASVRVKGTTNGTTTADNGAFSLAGVDEKAVLVISSINTEDREVGVNGRTNLDITLKLKVSTLVDLVVTGYSVKKVSEITGAVQTLSGKEVRSGVSTANTLAMLKGKVAGLYILETGTSNGSVSNRGQVIMRGQASLPDANNTNFGPLIVLDGVITTSSNLQDIVDASDIESITLLKDAASTAIYGSRAAQGVIVVTTRRGSAGKLAVNLSMNYGKVENNRLVNYMNTPQLITHMQKYMQALYNGTPSLRTQYGSFENYFNTTRIYTDGEANTNYDWSNNVLFPSGRQNDVNLSLSSGTDKTKFYGSLNWLKQDGTLLDDKLDRKNIRFNIDQKINEKLSVSINANAIIDKYTASSGENQSYVFLPFVSPYKANGELADSIPNYSYRATGARTLGWYSNPLYHHEWNTTITSRQSYLGTGIIKYAITPWLTAQSTNTYQYVYNNVNTYRDPRTYRGKYNGPATGPFPMNGELWLTDTKNTYYLTSNLLTFNKRFGEHQVTALAGEEFGKTHTETVSVSGYNTPYPGERNLGAFLSYGNGSSTWIYLRSGLPVPITSTPSVDKASFSLFSEINDNYKEKYFGSVSFRRDASTNFGRLHRYGNFYSVSGAWLLSKEDFMNSVRPVTNAKLRASYGTSGREAGADFLNFTTYQESTAYGYNTTSTTGAAIQRLANNEITWETTYTTDLGLDLGLWNRINLSVDLYNRRSAGLLQTVTLPSYQGSLAQIRNVGELQNRGIDVLLSTVNMKGAFIWTTDFNISFNKNKLTRIYGDSLIDGFTNSYYRYKGEDVNTLRAIIYAGVNPDNGRPLFERVMPNKSIVLVDSIPLVKQDGLRGYRTVGSATPKFFGGITNTFRYKGVSLSVLFNFVYGNMIMNNSLRNFISPDTWQFGQNTVQPDNSVRFWKGPGDKDANYPNYYDLAFNQRGATNINSSLIYQDASYIRLRNARLGYDLPLSVLGRLRVKSINVYISADNVFVIKSKELYAADPEGATIGTTASNAYAGAGIYSAMPRKFFAGINVGF
ncbi:MAG: SusC/RagA family TonB-linked outer membrane protein [Williamsia sp.]|nr:SusC/RagA family TonB-linked outer membrane protein [Williamsia sp.]